MILIQPSPDPPPATQYHRKEALWFWGIAVLALAAGLIHAISLAYINDDCYVSFRYARNLVDGLGLVYNAGERVEGFTTFLWTMLIAFGFTLRIDPVPLSEIAGIFFYLLTLALFAFLSWNCRRGNALPMLAFPLTALALGLHRDFSAYATSGMETSMFTFLVSASFACLCLGRGARSSLAAGAMLVLAMMTRPDGVIFLAAALVFLLVADPIHSAAPAW